MHFAAELAAAIEQQPRRYSRDHEDVNKLAATLPFALTRASDELPQHRAALADALRDAGRSDEADIAADATKHLRLYHDPLDGWYAEHATPRPPGQATFSHIGYDPAVRGYLDAALWSSASYFDDGDGRREGRTLDTHYNPHHFTDEAIDRAHHSVQKFLSKLPEGVRGEAERRYGNALGHDLWLTRNGHGSGFFDGDWEHGDELTDAARSLGEQSVEVEPIDEDDAHLHLQGGRD